MSVSVKPVGVVVLEEVKIGKEKIWTAVAGKGGIGNTEASIKHASTDTYVLEVKVRGASDFVWRFEIPKIKSYRIKTKSWHQLQYDGESKTLALRFDEDDENFQPFVEQLQVILRLHNKITKSKHSVDFMKVVRRSKLQIFSPLGDKYSRKGRTGGRHSNDETPQVNARDSDSDDNSPIVSELSIGKDSKDSVRDKGIVKTKKRPSELPSKKQLEASSGGGESSSLPRGTQEIPDSSDEDVSDRSSSPTDDPLYNASETYTYASFVDLVNSKQKQRRVGSSHGRQSPIEGESPHPLPLPLQQKSPVGNNDQKSNSGDEDKVKNRRRSGEPQPQRSSDKASKDRMEEALPPLEDISPPPPPLLPKKRNDQKPRNAPVSRTVSEPVRNHQNPNSTLTPGGSPAPLPPPPPRHRSSQDPTYGTAPVWRCDKCSFMNKTSVVTCQMCKWTRTDAWECRNCTKVYSTDLIHCQTCPVWRCRLCTFVNSEDRSLMTYCAACLQK